MAEHASVLQPREDFVKRGLDLQKRGLALHGTRALVQLDHFALKDQLVVKHVDLRALCGLTAHPGCDKLVKLLIRLRVLGELPNALEHITGEVPCDPALAPLLAQDEF